MGAQHLTKHQQTLRTFRPRVPPPYQAACAQLQRSPNRKGSPRFSRQWIHKLVKQGKFPKPVKIGEASIGFIETEESWIEGLIAQRDGEACDQKYSKLPPRN